VRLTPCVEIRTLVDDFLAGCASADIRKLREYDLTLEAYRDRLGAPARSRLPVHLSLRRTRSRRVRRRAPKYVGGDVRSLVDGLPGGLPGTGPVTRAYHENWVGWEAADAVITLELPRDGETATRLSFSALQEPKSWIWLPRSITVEGRGEDGYMRPIAELRHDIDEHANLAHGFAVDLPTDHRLVELVLTVDALETCPAWHLGAGEPCWFFLDELRVD
jgi:hypothetical protein